MHRNLYLKNISFMLLLILTLFEEGGQFCPTPRNFSNNFILDKVTQKRCQTCTRNLFFLLFSRKKIFNMSRDLPMMPFLISPWILWSNSYKIKSAVTLTKIDIWGRNFTRKYISRIATHLKWILRSFRKISRFFPISRFSMKSDIFEWFLD